MISNMRMIKVLKMIIVMAMMIPSKALGLQSIMLQKVIACGLSAIALGTTSTVVPQVEGLSLIRNGMPDIRYHGAQISQSKPVAFVRRVRIILLWPASQNLTSKVAPVSWRLNECERLTWSRWQRQFYNLSYNFAIFYNFYKFTCSAKVAPVPCERLTWPRWEKQWTSETVTCAISVYLNAVILSNLNSNIQRYEIFTSGHKSRILI